MNNIRELYQQWLKETNRSGSVITGKSMNEFFDYLEKMPDGHIVSVFGEVKEPASYVITTSDSYWKRRCDLAEKYIELSPCDPDVYKDQCEAYWEWKNFREDKQKP